MEEHGFPTKLVILIRATLDESQCFQISKTRIRPLCLATVTLFVEQLRRHMGFSNMQPDTFKCSRLVLQQSCNKIELINKDAIKRKPCPYHRRSDNRWRLTRHDRNGAISQSGRQASQPTNRTNRPAAKRPSDGNFFFLSLSLNPPPSRIRRL